MRTAWVTGGGTGIGRALAERLHREGSRVVITGRRQDVLEKAVRELAALGGSGQVFSVCGDAIDPAHVQDVLSQAAGRWGAIDLLINNAGANLNSSLLDATFEDYEKSFEINCLTAVRAVQAVLPAMLKAGRGSIVNISSIYGKWASSHSAAYSVSKYALSGYTDALRQELVGTPIHVLGVYPGFIETAMTLPFVQPGSLRSYLGVGPETLAAAILAALRKGKEELYYPWYVPWVLRLSRWAPHAWTDRLAHRVKR